jgi:hypothetical protein
VQQYVFNLKLLTESSQMNRKVFRYFEIAGQVALSKIDERSFLLGAVGIRADGVLVKSSNASAEIPNRFLHAEKKLSAKLTPRSIVYVARIRLDNGQYGMAKPCWDCEKVLRSKGVSRVYYTISYNEYGVINF